jgi:signal peptidase II
MPSKRPHERVLNGVKWEDFDAGGSCLIFKKLVRSYWFLLIVSGLVILLDQLSKAYIRANFVENVTQWAPWDWMLPYARIIHITNTGVAFGMFQGMNVVFAILATIVSGAIIYYYPRIPATDWILRLALSLQLAGAVGNLIDRIFIGNVTDFISVGTFAVFNVADSSISVGVAVLILGVWIQELRAKKQAVAAAQSTSADNDASTQDGKPREV